MSNNEILKLHHQQQRRVQARQKYGMLYEGITAAAEDFSHIKMWNIFKPVTDNKNLEVQILFLLIINIYILVGKTHFIVQQYHA
jgi:hypothetical protein